MSDISSETVHKIAKLSRIKIAETDIDPIAQKLNHILKWVEQLNEVDIDGVEPMTRILPLSLKMRDDVITDGGYPDDIVKNAPVKDGHFFCVPKVVE